MGGETFTGMGNWIDCPDSVYTTLMVVLPGPVAVTAPEELTVATVVFNEEYATSDDCVTRKVVPSEKSASNSRFVCSPMDSNSRPGTVAFSRVGMSGLSTSICTEAKTTPPPDVGGPPTVRVWVPQVMFVEGIDTEN